MKWLIILGLLILVMMLLALRFRRQIQAGIEIWRIFKEFKQAMPTEKKVEKIESERKENLVRCVSCGNWIAESEALNLRSKNYYCSNQCLEKSVVLR